MSNIAYCENEKYFLNINFGTVAKMVDFLPSAIEPFLAMLSFIRSKMEQIHPVSIKRKNIRQMYVKLI